VKRLPLVQLLQGTDSHHGFSTGNTLPLAARPFGMNHWSFQTAEGSWFFSPQHRKLMGIRCTHQPSPWIGDYASFLLMVQAGPTGSAQFNRKTPFHWSSAYRLDQCILQPNHLAAPLLADGIEMEMTPTERGAIFRFDFGDHQEGRVLFQPTKGLSEIAFAADGQCFTARVTGYSGGVPEVFGMFVYGEFSSAPVVEPLPLDPKDFDAGQREGDRLGFCAIWSESAKVVELRLATSFISAEQAKRNFDLEVGGRSFDEVKDEGERVWEANLSRIVPEGGTEDQQKTFTSCLYRTQLFPRIWHESNPDGGWQHRSPYDGGVHEGVLYTDNGFWDTYRTEYPLLALLDPARAAEIAQGWVNAYQEGGWFPQWASPGYRACMVGTHIDAVMADLVSRGVTNFDVAKALEGMLKHASTVGAEDGAFGRIGVEEYLEKGYVSIDHHESVARSLDYAYDDWCIAQVAKHLGVDDEGAEARSKNYRLLWDAEVGFMRGRAADGTWDPSWTEFRWGSPYVEGGPWQSLWAVPHDVEGLIDLVGGREKFLEKLERMLSMEPFFEVGAYGFEIHEMTEMAVADFGQYAHSNQPVHHVLSLFAKAGAPERTEHFVHRVLNELYSPTHLPGDEDNGEMSAWYVLASIGLFPACPGDGTWMPIRPLFERVTVNLPNGKVLQIEQSSTEAPGATGLLHAAVAGGGKLRHGAAGTATLDS